MRTTLCFLLINFCLFVRSQSLNQLFEESTQAYTNKNIPLFLKLNQKLDSTRPSHPKILYNLACAYALNSKSQEAISVLKTLILTNNSTAFENNEDLVSLRELADYKELLTLKNKLSVPVVHSSKVVELTEKDLHPEGIIYLPKHKLWLASSIRKHKITNFNIKTGECTDWLTDKNLLSVFALKADINEQFIWAATSSVPEMKNYTIETKGKGELLKIDIATKTIVQRFALDGAHVFGELVVTKKGDIYISDSNQPIIYYVNHNDNKLVPFVNLENEAYNLQGLTLNEDESSLFIADYLKGILKIDINNTNKKVWLEFQEDNTSKGIDGLVYYKNSLIAIHNGVNPIRIMNYTLNKEENKITKSTVVDMAREEFKEPTLACLTNHEIYFIANSPWSLYSKNNVLDLNKLKAPLLFNFKLTDK